MNNSSLNTGLLIVLVIGLIAGFWYFSSQRAEEEQRPGIEITLPSNNNDGGNQ